MIKFKSVEELRTLNASTLQEELTLAKKELFTQNISIELNTSRQTHLPRLLRKYVAQIKTVATEK